MTIRTTLWREIPIEGGGHDHLPIAITADVDVVPYGTTVLGHNDRKGPLECLINSVELDGQPVPCRPGKLDDDVVDAIREAAFGAM